MNTKRLLAISIIICIALGRNIFAAPVFNAPAVRIQPNGDTLHCLVSGDEYYHRLHDAKGYTIVQNPLTGWWVYAAKSGERRTENGERWDVVATDYVAGSVDPASVGLTPNVGVDRETWHKLQKRFDVPEQYQHTPAKTSGRNHGTLNNIVIYIRFSDDDEISTPLSYINSMFNDSSANSTSMYQYFKTVSYNKLHILTHYFPTPNGNSIISYQDSHPRSYYMPYNAATNANGYNGDNERANREFTLLENAVNYVNTNSPVPSSINLDMDNDGYVDNICFVVKGTYTGWNDLLWPHKWSLYDRYVNINGFRVYTFNLQLEGSGEHYFSSSTFCHEMFHTLGAPDLYRYENSHNVSGVGSWDLMCSNTTPPQNMGAYMKWKYGNWIDSIPTITVPGTYSLHSLGDPTYDNCVYKIPAQEPHQWYVLEYRDNLEQFETTLPGRGLLIYRIDDRFNGNANFDGISTFDEVYIFRPNAPNDTTNGNVAQAYFSPAAGRTQFTPTTNPFPWLTQNVIDTTIAITNITAPGETISFTYQDLRGCSKPAALQIQSIVHDTIVLGWWGRSGTYRLQYRLAGTTNTTTVETSTNSFTLTALPLNTIYEWRVMGICSADEESDYSDWATFLTARCDEPLTAEYGSAGLPTYEMPVNATCNSYVQALYTSDEIGGQMRIDRIAFRYASNEAVDFLDSCTIYLANTTKETFNGVAESFLVPFNELQQVYKGPIDCSKGWNYIVLDSPFLYDGVSNLAIAILNNSYSINADQRYKFHSTKKDWQSRTMMYTSFSPIDLSQSLSNCERNRSAYRPDIRFTGCYEDIERYHVTVQVAPASAQYGDAWFTAPGVNGLANDELLNAGTVLTLYAAPYTNIPGTVCTFTGWSDGNTESTRTIILTQDTVLLANFSGQPAGIETAEGDIRIATAGHNVTVSGVQGLAVEFFDITGRSLHRATGDCTHRLPAAGVYIVHIQGHPANKIVIK